MEKLLSLADGYKFNPGNDSDDVVEGVITDVVGNTVDISNPSVYNDYSRFIPKDYKIVGVPSGRPDCKIVQVNIAKQEAEPEPEPQPEPEPEPQPEPSPEPPPKKISRGDAINRLRDLETQIRGLNPSRKDQRERFNFYTKNLQPLLKQIEPAKSKKIDEMLEIIREIEQQLSEYALIKSGGYKKTRKNKYRKDRTRRRSLRA